MYIVVGLLFMDKHYQDIKGLIESNLVETKKNEIKSNYHTLETYFNVGRILIDAQGGEARAKYGNGLIKRYSVLLERKYGKNYNFSTLKRMRQFYLVFPKGATVSHQLSVCHAWHLTKQ